MKTLYIMRHRETLFNQKRLMQGWYDSPHTDQGIQQTKKIASYFKEHNIVIKEAYSSSLKRACDTLEIITPLPYQKVDGLKEWYFGKYEGESDDLDPPFPFQ